MKSLSHWWLLVSNQFEVRTNFGQTSKHQRRTVSTETSPKPQSFTTRKHNTTSTISLTKTELLSIHSNYLTVQGLCLLGREINAKDSRCVTLLEHHAIRSRRPRQLACFQKSTRIVEGQHNDLVFALISFKWLHRPLHYSNSARRRLILQCEPSLCASIAIARSEVFFRCHKN